MMRQQRIWRRSALALAAGVLSVAPPVSLAQQPGETGAMVEEVVVTARKRSENLVDVPLSISAFTEEFIEKSGIDSVSDLATQTPGLTLHQGFGRSGAGQGGGSSNRPTIRGQSNILGVPNVGFFVDGVYVSGNITSYQLDNLERVEVIRGPQSALFGRGTFAGAVNFISRKPGEQLRGKIETTVAEYDNYEVNGFVSGPLIPGVLSAELNGRYYDFGGDWKNRATGRSDGGEQSSRNVGASVYFTPSDALTVALNAGWSEDIDGAYVASYTGIQCHLPTIVSNGPPLPRSSTRQTGYYCGEVESEDSFFTRTDLLDAASVDGVNRTTWRSSLRADYDVNDWTITTIAAYNSFRNQNASDRTFEQAEISLRPTALGASEDRRSDWSIESRIASPTDRRLRGLVGAYYYREEDGDGYRLTFGLPPGPVPIGATNVVHTRIDEQNDSGVRNWSVFGMLDFDITDALSVTAEGRYQVDEIISDQQVLNPSNVLLETSFKKFLPRFTGLYRLNEDWNVFANVAKGNKPGGFNVLPDDADAASAEALSRFQSYDEESAWTYEIGMKGSNAARTLSLSTSVYMIDWTSQQLTRTEAYTRVNGTTFARSLIQNAGESRVLGLEIDASVRPADWLSLRLAYAYSDAEIRDFVDEVQEDLYDTDGLVGQFNPGNDPTGQTRGNKLPQTPAHQVILSGEATRAINSGWTGFIRGDMTYESRRFAQVHNLADSGESYLLNLRLGAETDNVSVTFFVKNALDDRTPAVVSRFVDFTRSLQVPSNLNPAQFQTVTFRDMLVAHPRKRQFGISAAYRF